MNPGEFAYWLQGALELNPNMLKEGMTPEQVQTIQDHLNLVFTKVTPYKSNKEETVKSLTLEDLRISNSGLSTGGHTNNAANEFFSVENKVYC